jgi:hypothetical protein
VVDRELIMTLTNLVTTLELKNLDLDARRGFHLDLAQASTNTRVLMISYTTIIQLGNSRSKLVEKTQLPIRPEAQVPTMIIINLVMILRLKSSE